MDNLSKPVKILLGLGTLWPAVYQPIFMTFMFRPFAQAMEHGDFSGGILRSLIFMPIQLFTVLLVLALAVFFMAHAISNERMGRNTKTFWVVAILILHMLIMPVYWYLYIWREAAGPVNSEQ